MDFPPRLDTHIYAIHRDNCHFQIMKQCSQLFVSEEHRLDAEDLKGGCCVFAVLGMDGVNLALLNIIMLAVINA